MSQNTSAASSTPTSNLEINPALQAALGTLDIDLEQELTRYRRKQGHLSVGTSRPLTSKPNEPSLAFVSVPTDEDSQTTAIPTDSDTSETAEAPEIPSQAQSRDDTSAAESNPTASPPVAEAETSTQATGSELVPTAPTQPEGYLESSEKLLQSLAEDEANIESQKRLADRLLTPLGIGSILLLLLSGATLVYLINDPATRSVLGINRFFEAQTPTTASNPTQPSPLPNQAEAEEEITPNGPDLSVEEFPDVNLDSLNRLEASPLPEETLSAPEGLEESEEELSEADTPAETESQTTADDPLPSVPIPDSLRESTDLSSTLLPPSVRSPDDTTMQTPPSVPPLPTQRATTTPEAAVPSPASPQNEVPSVPSPSVAEAPPAGDSYYYVLVNYDGGNSLGQAQAIVPNAYLREFPQGVRIQMGAFKVRTEAQSLVEQLERQGISASVYRP